MNTTRVAALLRELAKWEREALDLDSARRAARGALRAIERTGT